eukprot:GEMP01060579.1.p1 GENE.GEMP01060579.1~~GEMP01060579.1.p1  ORF type:complete len:279 (+),score=50.10 GEMP01060579.1:318-1154(+)
MCDVVLAIEELCLENIDHHWLGVLLEIALFGYAFIGLALMCDKFLVPALETLCLKWNISEDLAGATFMAFGSGAPEVILSTLVTLRSVTNESLHISERHGIHRTSGLGVSTILGSAWIAYLLIPACCTFLAKRDIYVNHGGLVRDMSFYLMALVFLYNFGFDRTFNFSENIAMILGYCLYTLVVVVQSMWQYLLGKKGREREAIKTKNERMKMKERREQKKRKKEREKERKWKKMKENERRKRTTKTGIPLGALQSDPEYVTKDQGGGGRGIILCWLL